MQRRTLALSIAALLLALAAPAAAQTGARPVRIMVPFSPGSQTDLVARLIAKSLEQHLEQPVIVENRPGAAGTVAAQAVLAQPADGHTLMMVSSAYAVLAASGRKLPYSPERDFDIVGVVARSANVLIASKASGFRTVAEIVAAGKAAGRPALNFGSSGVGSGTHLNAEYFATATGIRTVHIPLKGGPEILNEVMSGRVEFAFVPPSQVLSSGTERLSMLGITGQKRVRQLPDVPTVNEAGVKGFEYYLWYALMQKSGTPPAAAQRLSVALARSLVDPAVMQPFDSLGIEGMRLNLEAARGFMRTEIAANKSLIQSRGLQIE